MNSQILLTIGIIGFTLLIFNAIFLAIIFVTQRKMNAIKDWSSTLGTVNASYLERRRSGNRGSTNYPVVRYSYQVMGKMYESAKLAPGPEMGGTGAGKVVARYSVGAQVMVFYDPQNPSDAVLERKASAQWVMWLILFIIDCSLCGTLPIIWLTMAGT